MDNSASWEPVAEVINESIREFLSKVYKIWDEMGLTEEAKSVRFKQVSQHVTDLITDMLFEAEGSRNALVQEVQKLIDEATSLSKELQSGIRVAGYEHLPFLEIKARILSQLQQLRADKQQRLNFAKELLKKEREICKTMGSVPAGMKSELPSETELKSFRLYLDTIEAEKTRMEATFKESQRAIIEMMDDLRMSPTMDFENLVYNNGESFIFNNANMTKLKELEERLKHQIQEAKQEVHDKINQLQDLWKYLEEPAEKCQRFLDCHTGYTLVTLKAFDEEIKRCKQKRSENIAKYVGKVRCQIEALWDQCHIGNEERRAFHIMQYQTFTEDLLILHEMELEKLQKYYQDNKQIFELLEVRDNLWQQMTNLQERATDPNRFHNRGGQLLAEEKERKVIQKKLPKIEEDIKALVNAYELKSGKPFTSHGVPLSEALKQSWADYFEAKQTVSMARKQARDQSGILKKTPLSVSKRTPSAMSIRRSPANSVQKKQADLTPLNPSSRKRRNRSSESNKLTVSGSKIKRGKCRASRRIFTQSTKTSGSENENLTSQQVPTCSSTSISSYGEFQEHLENRDELRSSVLPRKILKTSNRKPVTSTRIKTPMKPLRKNLTAASNTPGRSSPKLANTPRTTPRALRSPRTASNSRLAPAPGVLPFIF